MTDLDKLKQSLVVPRPALGSGAKARREPQSILDDVLRVEQPRRVVIAFDGTGSMGPHWSHVRDQLTAIGGRLLAGRRLQLRFVAYRDHCDGNLIIEKSAWAAQPRVLEDFIRGITCGGGGDDPEAVDMALRACLDEPLLDAVVLVGDAPPHSDADGLHEARALRARQVPVHSIAVGQSSQTHAAFAAISRESGGRQLKLDDPDELYDILGAVLAHAAGALASYRAVTAGGERARRLLVDGNSR